MKRLLVLLTAFGLTFLAGCSNLQMENPKNSKEPSLLYGYIDMDDAPANMQWASISQLTPPSEKPSHRFRVDDGLFYAEWLEKGAYQLDTFGGESMNTYYTFNFPGGDPNFRAKVEKPGIYFMGAFKYVDNRSMGQKVFKTGGTYDLEPIKAPSEKELLTRLLKRAKGTVWEERINKRLGQLK